MPKDILIAFYKTIFEPLCWDNRIISTYQAPSIFVRRIDCMPICTERHKGILRKYHNYVNRQPVRQIPRYDWTIVVFIAHLCVAQSANGITMRFSFMHNTQNFIDRQRFTVSLEPVMMRVAIYDCVKWIWGNIECSSMETVNK